MHPDYYKDTGIHVEAIDVMEYLPANLANAFKYLVRAGNKPGNSFETEFDKASTYLEKYLWSDIDQVEHPDAWPILKFFCIKSGGDLSEFCKHATCLRDWARNANELLNANSLERDRLESARSYLNEVARLRHLPLPYPNIPNKSDEIYHEICVINDFNNLGEPSGSN